MKKQFVIVWVTTLLFSCYGKQYIVTPHDYVAPVRSGFKLKNTFSLTDTSFLSPNAIYKQNSYGDEIWLKFYQDGRLFFGSLSKVPKLPGNRAYGYTGYYKLNGNKIVAEIYYVQQVLWDYLVLEGEIKGDTIRFYKDHYRNTHRNIKHFTNLSRYEERFFTKTYQPFCFLDPDW